MDEILTDSRQMFQDNMNESNFGHNALLCDPLEPSKGSDWEQAVQVQERHIESITEGRMSDDGNFLRQH